MLLYDTSGTGNETTGKNCMVHRFYSDARNKGKNRTSSSNSSIYATFARARRGAAATVTGAGSGSNIKSSSSRFLRGPSSVVTWRLAHGSSFLCWLGRHGILLDELRHGLGDRLDFLDGLDGHVAILLVVVRTTRGVKRNRQKYKTER
jgi:hypothetical protein